MADDGVDLRMVDVCALTVQRVCEKNQAMEGLHRSHFHSNRVPPISVLDYVKRIAKYSRCSPQCLPIALIYIDRFIADGSDGAPLTLRNVHRLLITSVMVAAKIRDDQYYSNEFYASIGGVSLKELNELEVLFLEGCGHRMWVEPQEYTDWLQAMEAATYGTAAPQIQAAGQQPQNGLSVATPAYSRRQSFETTPAESVGGESASLRRVDSWARPDPSSQLV